MRDRDASEAAAFLAFCTFVGMLAGTCVGALFMGFMDNGWFGVAGFAAGFWVGFRHAACRLADE